MKPAMAAMTASASSPFSTLNSGLRDETTVLPCPAHPSTALSVPSTRAYAMKLLHAFTVHPFVEHLDLSVPSTRAYAMKHDDVYTVAEEKEAFSTLNSGLRDETQPDPNPPRPSAAFQYPQLGPTR